MVDYKVSEGNASGFAKRTEHDLYSVEWKWLWERFALKVGINAGLVALPFKNR